MKPFTIFEVDRHRSFTESDLDNSDFRVLEYEGNKMKVSIDGKNYDSVIRSFNLDSKICTINIDGFDFTVTVKEPLDQLVDDLGFLKAVKHSVKEINSPMPGLVVQIFVEIGQSVIEGEKLLSLEAMKMENILKSPGDGIVKSINVKNGNTVEKNQVLIEFE